METQWSPIVHCSRYFRKQIFHPKDPFVCPKEGIGPPTFPFFSDGIGTRKILFDREGSDGFLGSGKHKRKKVSRLFFPCVFS